MTDIKPWQEISREEVFKKFSRKVDKVVFRLPDGQEDEYYLKVEGPVVCGLALTPDNKVILARQFRPGPNEILSELPGGYIDNTEKPEESMARELLEETGYQGKVQYFGVCLDDAYSTMKRYCFVITDCVKVAEPQPDSDEFLDIVLVTVDEYRRILRTGLTTDVEVGYLALDFLKLL